MVIVSVLAGTASDATFTVIVRSNSWSCPEFFERAEPSRKYATVAISPVFAAVPDQPPPFAVLKLIIWRLDPAAKSTVNVSSKYEKLLYTFT